MNLVQNSGFELIQGLFFDMSLLRTKTFPFAVK